jgi:Rad3-related DNA helicase
MSTTSSASPRASADTTPPLVEHENRSIQGPVWVAWREGTLTRAEELQALCEWMVANAKETDPAKTNHQTLATAIHRRLKIGKVKEKEITQNNYQVLADSVKRHLDAARQAATKKALDPNRRLVLIRRIFRNGPLIERAQSNLDAAEVQLLNLAPASYILGQMPCLLRHVRCHLPSNDPGRQEFERIARRLGINDADRSLPQKSEDQDIKGRENIVEADRGKIVTTEVFPPRVGRANGA